MALLLLKTLQTTHFFSFLYSSQLRGFLNISYLQNLLHTHTHTQKVNFYRFVYTSPVCLNY